MGFVMTSLSQRAFGAPEMSAVQVVCSGVRKWHFSSIQ
jgi:hypothetical protein